jgi:hypothetical protein
VTGLGLHVQGSLEVLGSRRQPDWNDLLNRPLEFRHRQGPLHFARRSYENLGGASYTLREDGSRHAVTVNINVPADWKKLRQDRLLIVLDPFVFRAADAFLRGAPVEGDEPLWEAISKSIDAFAVFVDAVMLHEQLPIFDYGVTWEPQLAGSAARLVDICNEDEELLVEVHVDGAAYQQARAPAIKALVALPKVKRKLATDIRGELSALDYRWRPQLAELGDLDEEARMIASFRYGGLLFHGYADAISDRRQPLDRRAEHVLHAKRALILLATSLAPSGELRLDEQKLMRTLRRVERDTDGAVEAVDVKAPTFLPYLLAKEPRSPRDLLRLALRERRSGLVRSYREWRLRLLSDLADGRVRRSTQKELRGITAEIQRNARGEAAAALHLSYAADWKLLLAAVVGDPAALLGGVKLEGEVNQEALRFRLASILPGRGYRKLLSKVVASQDEYFALDRALRNVWYRGE